MLEAMTDVRVPSLTDLLEELVTQALKSRPPTRDQALAILSSSDGQLLDVVAAAAKVRHHFFSNRVKLNFLVNLKSGLCPEDCSYCSQRRGSDAEILKYFWIDPTSALDAASRARDAGAKRICLVASGRGPSARDLGRVIETVQSIKHAYDDLEICVSLGLLEQGQPEQLVEAGVFAYNHNLNTSEGRYEDICSTHTFADRQATLDLAHRGGLSPCSGAIFGMGEDDDDIVDVAFALRALEPDSVPINFLMPFEGTPLAGRNELTPQRCLRILALYRFMFPDVEVRVAGGREMHLRSLQPLALHLANSIFLGDYLTSEGQPGAEDLQMIADGGFVIEGRELDTLGARPSSVSIRRRGPGTDLPPNA
jgi:biotin synthase